jgi:hypothetical protein
MAVLIPIRQPPESSSGPPLFPANTQAQMSFALIQMQSHADQAAARVEQRASAVSCKHTSMQPQKLHFFKRTTTADRQPPESNRGPQLFPATMQTQMLVKLLRLHSHA